MNETEYLVIELYKGKIVQYLYCGTDLDLARRRYSAMLRDKWVAGSYIKITETCYG